MDQGVLYIAFPQFQPAIGHIEISIDLMVLSHIPGLQLQECLFWFLHIRASGFKFKIDMHGQMKNLKLKT
jgi:hypothetical protein